MRVLPHSMELERALLSAALVEGATVIREAEGITIPEHFYSDAHARIWAACLVVVANGRALDGVTLRDQLTASGDLARVGSDEYLLSLADVVAATETETIAKDLRDLWNRRELIRICHEQASIGYDRSVPTVEFIQGTEARVFGLARDSALDDGGLEAPGVGLSAYWNHVQRIAESGGILGTRTHIPTLDAMLEGLWDEDLVIVGGRPSMGKTAFAETVMLNAASRMRPDETALFFSLEMGHVTLWPRLIAKVARIDSRQVRGSLALSQDNARRVSAAVEELNGYPMQIDTTTGLSIAQLRSRARKAALTRKVKLIVVDYLQIVRPSQRHERRDLEVAEVAQGLKLLAREIGCPVVALAQVNRATATRADKRPTMADISDSSAVEKFADVIMLLHREAYYAAKGEGQPNVDQGDADVIVDKNRNGMTGAVKLRYIPHLCEFVAAEGTREEYF